MEKIDNFIGDEEVLKSSEFKSDEQKNKELKKKMKRVFLGVFVVLALFLTFTIYNFFFNIHPYDKQPLIYLKKNDVFMKNSDRWPTQFTLNANINSLESYNLPDGTSIASGTDFYFYSSESKHYLWFILNGSLYVKSYFLIPTPIDVNVESFVVNKEGNSALYVKNNNGKLSLYLYKSGLKSEQVCENLYFSDTEKNVYQDQKGNAYGFTEDDRNFYYYKKGVDGTKLFSGSGTSNIIEVAQGNSIFNNMIMDNKVLFSDEQGLYYKDGSIDASKIDSGKTQLLYVDNNFGYYYLKQDDSGSINSLYYGKANTAAIISDGISNILDFNPKISAVSYLKKGSDGGKDAVYVNRDPQQDEILVVQSDIGVIDRNNSIMDFDILSDINKFSEFNKLALNVQFDDNYNTCAYLDDVTFKSSTDQKISQPIFKIIDSGTLFLKKYNSGNYENLIKIDEGVLDFRLSSDGKRIVYLKRIAGDDGRNTISLFYRDISETENIEAVKSIDNIVSIKFGKNLEGITFLDTQRGLYLSDKGTSPKLLMSDVKAYNINNIGTIDIISNAGNTLYICEYNKTPAKVDEGVSQIVFF